MSVAVHKSGSSGAGENYTLVCTVTKIVGLTDSPSVLWRDPAGSTVVQRTGIFLDNQTFGQTTNFMLNFQPLKTSSAGEYVCLVTLPSPAIMGDITVNASQVVTIESM